MREAEHIFESARDRGATAFRWRSGKPAERVDRFDPRADEVVIVPRVAGGAISNDQHADDAGERLPSKRSWCVCGRTSASEVAARLGQARESPGDQSDNLELLEAQHDLSMLEARIAELEYALAQAKVVEVHHGDLG